MPLTRMLLAVVAGFVLLGCLRPDDVRLTRALEAAACAGVPAVEYQKTSHGIVLSVSVQQCSAVDGGPLASDEAHELMSRVIWSTTTHRFDALLVTVYRTAGEVRTAPRSREILREELEARYGQRSPALDDGDPAEEGSGLAWIVLPGGASVMGVLALIWLVRATLNGRVVPVWIIRL